MERTLLLQVMLLLLPLASCATSELVPSQMKSQITRDVSFQEIKADAERFKGLVVVVGGQVVGAKRLKDQTEIEVLQLPLDKSDRPILNLLQSKGRFLAVQKEFLDPATVPLGSNLSVIGEVLGSRSVPLDHSPSTYPTFQIKALKVWPKNRSYESRGFPFWDRWAYPFEDPWTHPYWGAY